MDNDDFKELVIKKLDKLEERHDKAEERHETRHERMQEYINDIKESQLDQALAIKSIEIEIPIIQRDLFEHKEGNIQARKRIEHIESIIEDQDALIEKSLEAYRKEMAPIVEHVMWIQTLPSKTKDFLISTSKVLGAIAAIGASIAAIMQWF
jgi:2-oxoglutarate dehydrogenase complex dehydrogenase (E1) component-like enzyme